MFGCRKPVKGKTVLLLYLTRSGFGLFKTLHAIVYIPTVQG